jgi:NADPH-dependent curcumin reductase
MKGCLRWFQPVMNSRILIMRSRTDGNEPRWIRAVLDSSLTLRGFIQNEFAPTMFDDFLRDVGAWVREGKIKYREDVTKGLDHAPEAFAGMLEGKNFGKTLVQVADLS